ncbi:MAG TPA: response regulator transcription factor [Vicinamibacteria bacterium]|jgi:two-component system nitrate/nitrite response regulator NarL
MKRAPERPLRATPVRTVGPVRRRTTRVLLADDHPIARRGLAAVLAPYEHLQLVGEARNVDEALLLFSELEPDVVVVDCAQTTEVLTRIQSQAPQVGLVVFSNKSDEGSVRKAVLDGARGYVLKTAPTEELVKAIEAVHAGQAYFSPIPARIVAEGLVSKETARPLSSKLTRREMEVLRLVTEGKTSKEIGKDLSVSARTVDTHRERIMRKLDVHTAAGLTRFAIAHGIVPTS